MILLSISFYNRKIAFLSMNQNLILKYNHIINFTFIFNNSNQQMNFSKNVSRLILSQVQLNCRLSQHFASFSCNNCSRKTTLPQCTACHRMVNYFNIFNIPQQYTVNQSIIANKAKQLQKEYHPDKHSFNQEMQQIFKENMEKYSAYINDAKATLLDDMRRATYMMELRGVEIEDSREIQDNKFMTEMFQLQQEIQEANRQMCEEIKKRIEEIMLGLKGQFDEFFRSEDMKKCKEFVFKYKYLHRALQNLNQKLNSIEVGGSQQ